MIRPGDYVYLTYSWNERRKSVTGLIISTRTHDSLAAKVLLENGGGMIDVYLSSKHIVHIVKGTKGKPYPGKL